MEECAVCLDDTPSFVVPCRHAMCIDCSDVWFRRRMLCPVCMGAPAGMHTSETERLCGVTSDALLACPLEAATDGVRLCQSIPPLEEGHVIYRVNCVRVRTKSDVQTIARRAQETGVSIRLTRLPRDKKEANVSVCPCLPCFAQCFSVGNV